MDRGDDVDNQVVGGPAPHVPVMLNEVLKTLNPASGDIILDGTFGAGGYTQAILQQGARVIALDRDPNAIRDGSDLVRSSKDMLILKEGEFGELDHHVTECGYDALDGVVLDIGVSSMQLDQADRGFSFQSDGPLDMRMAQHGVSAADVINLAKQSDLTRIIGILGEERNASQVSRAIVRQRAQTPFSTTKQLAAVIEKVLPRKAKDRIHPATRTFQALRMFVNQELWQLADALCAAERVLQEGGRLVVVTFHSLEDRLVKLFFRDRMGGTGGSRHLPEAQAPASTFHVSGKSLLKPTLAEIEVNARARSAKLRWGVRTAEPARQINASIFGLPNLVSLDQFALKGDGHAL